MFSDIWDWFMGLSKRTRIWTIVLIVSLGIYAWERISQEIRWAGREKRQQQEYYDNCLEVADRLADINDRIDDLGNEFDDREMEKLEREYRQLSRQLDADDAYDEETEELTRQIDDLQSKTQKRIEDLYANAKKNLVKDEGILIENTKVYPVHLERGECLYYDIALESPSMVRICNSDKETVLQTYKQCTEIHDSLPVRFPAIYLIEITTKGKQYADVQLDYRTPDRKRFKNTPVVKEEAEQCKAGDFMAKKILGIRMLPAFEEPRKFTLRSNLKSAFSGNSRVLVPIQVPAGATDILYNLRISTNERRGDNEQDFYRGMETSYNKVKIMGLPLYESQENCGLLATMLGLNLPVREEDAYVNMFVFYSASEARKFQNGTAGTNLKYNLDYSTLGTQSCNGRIPCKGYKTVYLGFENERMRYNNYIWLSALLSTPQTEYTRIKYSIEEQNQRKNENAS